jgi:hypothetical protein
MVMVVEEVAKASPALATVAVFRRDVRSQKSSPHLPQR